MTNQGPADEGEAQNGVGGGANAADIESHSKPTGGKKLQIPTNNKEEKKKKGIKAKCCK